MTPMSPAMCPCPEDEEVISARAIAVGTKTRRARGGPWSRPTGRGDRCHGIGWIASTGASGDERLWRSAVRGWATPMNGRATSPQNCTAVPRPVSAIGLHEEDRGRYGSQEASKILRCNEHAMGEPKRRLRILFVDDDPRVLDALRRSLFRRDEQWEMHFLDSGESAVDALRTTDFDVVISDMNMPGMGGDEFLEQVRSEHPSVVRIAFSGWSENYEASNDAPLAHQFLDKPIDIRELAASIDRASGLRRRLDRPQLEDFVGTLEGLPSEPKIYSRLCQLLRSGDASLREIAAVVEQDPAISASVLRLANSAFFGLSRTLSSVRDAAVMLGVVHLKSVVLAVELANAFPAVGGISDLSVGREHERSMLIAALLRDIFDVDDADTRFTVGLLHGLGRLVMAMRWCQLQGEREVTTMASMLEDSEVDPPAVCGVLLEAWGIPSHIVEAVVHHQRPADYQHDTVELADALHLTTATVDELLGPRPGAQPLVCDEEHLKRVANPELLMFWRRKLETRMRSLVEEGPTS